MVLSLVLNVGGSITHWGADLLTSLGVMYHRNTTSRVAKNIAKSYAQGFAAKMQQLMMPKVFGRCMVLVWHCDNFVARVGKAATYLKAGAGASNVYICYTLQGLASSLRNMSILKKPPERSVPVMPGFLQVAAKNCAISGRDTRTNFFPLVYLDTGVKSFLVSFSCLGLDWMCWCRVVRRWISFERLLSSVEAKSSSFAHYQSNVINYIEELTCTATTNLLRDGHLIVCHDIGKKPLYFASFFFFHVPIFASTNPNFLTLHHQFVFFLVLHQSAICKGFWEQPKGEKKRKKKGFPIEASFK